MFYAVAIFSQRLRRKTKYTFSYTVLKVFKILVNGSPDIHFHSFIISKKITKPVFIKKIIYNLTLTISVNEIN